MSNTHEWMPGVERSPMPDPAAYTSPYPNRVVWHITTGHSGFDNMKSYLRTPAAPTPHFLVNPWSGRIVQFYQVYSRAKGLKVSGGFNPNRTGNLCIQVEILHDFSDGDVKDTPRRGIIDKLVPYFRTFGIPDRWCLGMPHRTHDQNMDVWLHQGGHFGHSQVPGNNHSDPGDMGDIFNNNDKGVDMSEHAERMITDMWRAQFETDRGDHETEGFPIGKIKDKNVLENIRSKTQDIHDDVRQPDFGMRREIIETKDKVAKIEENQKEILRLLRKR